MEAKLILTITAVLAFALAGCAAKPPNPERFVAAIEVTASAKSFALSWLSLVDESKDAEAFAQTSELYRQTTSESSFLANLKSDRPTRGTPVSRTAIGSEFFPRARNLPDGQYVVSRFLTVFEPGGAEYVETVAVSRERDGRFLVISNGIARRRP